MKYVAYRVSSQRIEDNEVINAFSVLGQRSTDLNWDYIHKFDEGVSIGYAMQAMIDVNEFGVQMYDTHGYEVTRD